MSEEYIKAVEDNHRKMEDKITELINLVNDKQEENERLKAEIAALKDLVNQTGRESFNAGQAHATLKAKQIENSKVNPKKVIQIFSIDHAMANNWKVIALCVDGTIHSYDSAYKKWFALPKILN